jgi:hypothetical protein
MCLRLDKKEWEEFSSFIQKEEWFGLIEVEQ